jgi:hypothetical protein
LSLDFQAISFRALAEHGFAARVMEFRSRKNRPFRPRIASQAVVFPHFLARLETASTTRLW